MTIQMTGVLLGGLIVGQFADYFGRKPALYLSELFLMITNLASAFSVSWEMFAVLRFFVGLWAGFILTVELVWMYEFLSASKRAFVTGIPSWTLFAALFALICWLLHDWMYLHIATAAMAAPVFLSWW